MGGKANGSIPVLNENIPISVDALADIKSTIGSAADAKEKAVKLAVTYTQIHKALTDMGDQAIFLEDAVNEKARQILATHNVTEDKFVGFDFEKGVIIVSG